MTRKSTDSQLSSPHRKIAYDNTWLYLLSVLGIAFSLGVLGWVFAIKLGNDRARRGIIIAVVLSIILIASAWIGNDYQHLMKWLWACWIITGVCGLFVWVSTRQRIKRRIQALGSANYLYSEHAKPLDQVNILKQMVFYLRSTNQVWYVEFEQTPRLNPRDSTLRETVRIPIQLIDKLPYGIEYNVEIWGIQMKQLGIFFLPDALFLETETHCRHVPFRSINMHYTEHQYNQPDSVPSDAPVLGKTWLHTTMKGKPDMRFKYNPEVTTVRYGIIDIDLRDGHHLFIQTSNPTSAKHFVACWQNLKILCV